MSLKDQVQSQMIEAIKAKDTIKTSTLRMLKAEILKFETSGSNKETTDEILVSIIQKQLKQRKDAAEQYLKGGRPELAEKEEQEAKILEAYLPEQMSEEEVRGIIKTVITEVGATSKADIGKVMGAIMTKIKGKADGKVINRIVQELLA
ncbi:GatB/YqeY domain-containing protein [Patescibacteria group bacterium]|nr:GatB/YqeY domain-containing protein [Patescibacteria group bacterium]